MTIRVGINGFGRIGRQVLKASLAGGYSDLFEIVSINDLSGAESSAHLLKYDSTYGKFPGEVIVGREDEMTVNGQAIKVHSERDPADLPWEKEGVDIVIEATGRFTDADKARAHLTAGAKKVIITAPAKHEDVTIVLGVNEDVYDPDQHNIISNASCTTNCLAPVAKVVLDQFGIKRGMMTTVHAYTNDQVTLDGPHRDMRRARSAAANIIPTTTGAARSISLVIPALKGKFDGFSLRVPVTTVSLVDLVVETEKSVTKESINEAFKAASESDVLQGILGYSEEPLVSSDYRHDSRSGVIDALSTMAIDRNLAKIIAWYDNEWGYSCRIADLTALICEAGIPGTA
jgi:glyceraldehyde 3-phosphate dehydrogenase (phosphorylating)